MKPAPPIRLWCRACTEPYDSRGAKPAVCPKCYREPNWTLTPPYKLNRNDRGFLRSIRVRPE